MSLLNSKNKEHYRASEKFRPITFKRGTGQMVGDLSQAAKLKKDSTVAVPISPDKRSRAKELFRGTRKKELQRILEEAGDYKDYFIGDRKYGPTADKWLTDLSEETKMVSKARKAFAGKAALGTAIVGGLGYGGYKGYEHYKNQKTASVLGNISKLYRKGVQALDRGKRAIIGTPKERSSFIGQMGDRKVQNILNKQVVTQSKDYKKGRVAAARVGPEAEANFKKLHAAPEEFSDFTNQVLKHQADSPGYFASRRRRKHFDFIKKNKSALSIDQKNTATRARAADKKTISGTHYKLTGGAVIGAAGYGAYKDNSLKEDRRNRVYGR